MDNKDTIALWYSVFMAMFWLAFSIHIDVVGFYHLLLDATDFEEAVLDIRIPICFYLAVITYVLSVAAIANRNLEKTATCAKVLNYLLFVLLLAIAIYAFSGNTTMTKKIMRMELFGSLFVVIIPSVLNIRALAKIGK